MSSSSTEALVQSLRNGDAKSRGYRQMQVTAAIRFCDVLFGHDYASLMSRAAENALTGEQGAFAQPEITHRNGESSATAVLFPGFPGAFPPHPVQLNCQLPGLPPVV